MSGQQPVTPPGRQPVKLAGHTPPHRPGPGDWVQLPEGPVGKIETRSRNGWLAVRTEAGELVNVRGAAQLRLVEAPVLTQAEDTEEPAAEAAPAEQAQAAAATRIQALQRGKTARVRHGPVRAQANKEDALGPEDWVQLPEGPVGKIETRSRNGWLAVRTEAGELVNVRGAAQLRLVEAPVLTQAEDTEEPAAEAAPAEQAVADLYDYVPRTAAAKLRRDATVPLCEGLPAVAAGQLRLVVAGKTGPLQYERLGEPGVGHTLPQEELAELEQRSGHFRKAWAYVRDRGNSRLWGLGQETEAVVYLAVMLMDPPVELEVEANGQRLSHSGSDQAYVGMAARGVQARWATAGNHHIKCSNALHIKTSRQDERSNSMLVDASMRLHCARGGVVWLFVVQHNTDLPLGAEESRLIEYFGTLGSRGMNGKA